MLKCISPYRSSLGAFAPGDTVEDPRLELALLKDSPASFEQVEPEPVQAPPAVEVQRGPGRRWAKA